MSVRNEAAGLGDRRTFRAIVMVAALALGGFATGTRAAAQTTGQAPAQSKPTQDADIPDAPMVQPNSEPAEPPPIPKPEEKKPADLNPWTNQPNQPNQPASKPGTDPNAFPEDDPGTTPAMPPVTTLPPGSTKPNPKTEEQLYKIRSNPTFVQFPVTVTDDRGRLVDGLLPTDFVVKENGTVQELKFFSADPFALSVAIVLDLGMPDIDVQKVNQTFGALVGAFSPYDEISLYTYSSTVSQVSDFMAASQKMTALLNQMKTERGHANGVPVMSGPLASGPMINGIPVGSPTQGVNTPPKEAHVLNDAILQAALGMRKRDKARRKIILVISDGRESGSEAGYKDVLRVLLSNEIQVKGIAVDAGALPVYSKLERLHLPRQGYDDLLPKYVAATGGQPLYKELSRNAIEEIYATAMSEARNQYTLGYIPVKPKVPTTGAYRNIEVVVHRPGLKIYAKDGYYPAIVATR